MKEYQDAETIQVNDAGAGLPDPPGHFPDLVALAGRLPRRQYRQRCLSLIWISPQFQIYISEDVDTLKSSIQGHRLIINR